MKKIFTLWVLIILAGLETSAQINSGTSTRAYSDPGSDTLLRVTLYNVDADPNKDSIVDGVLDQFGYNYCDCVDSLDARKAGNTGESLSILVDDTLLAVERQQTVVSDDTVFLYLSGARVQQYRFSIDAQYLNTIPSGFLQDLYTQTLTPINLNGHTDVYITVANITGSYAPNRFRIVFSTFNILPIIFTSIKAYEQATYINVAWSVDNERNTTKYIVEKSANGRDFTNLTAVMPKVNNGASASYEVSDMKPAGGYNYYRIKSVDINGAISYSTIVKVLIAVPKEDIHIYPNPITDGQIHLQFSNEAAGKYGIRLLNKLGQVIMNKEITHQDGASTELLKWDFKLAHGTYQLEVTSPGGSIKNINLIY